MGAQFKRIPALSMDSLSQIVPSKDEFYVEYDFSVVQINTLTGEILKSKDYKHQAINLYSAFMQFQNYLFEKGYYAESSHQYKYLLIGNKRPIISSSLIKCTLKPSSCNKETVDLLRAHHNIFSEKSEFHTQAMIGWAIKNKLIQFGEHSSNGGTSIQSEVDILGSEQMRDFYIIQNMKNQEYEIKFFKTDKQALEQFDNQVDRGYQGILMSMKHQDDVDIKIVKVSTSQEGGQHSGENEGYAAFVRWLNDVKQIYERPAVDPRPFGFRMRDTAEAVKEEKQKNTVAQKMVQ